MIKNQEAILQKLGIEQLNEMQLATQEAINSFENLLLLSPTGTGKTLAFLLPLLALLDPEKEETQLLIIVPARELAIQIEQVIRNMGTGFKANAVYGGRSGSKDKIELKKSPAILIGTPGRVADHLRRENILGSSIQYLVLDEYDKSLEIGFEKEMKEILSALPMLKKKILTSATAHEFLPDFIDFKSAQTLNFLSSSKRLLSLKLIKTEDNEKPNALVSLLNHLGEANGIVFCNFKESIQQISQHLQRKGIPHGLFYGGMEQTDRERALIKFRNGSHRTLLATDLAARGIDVPSLDYIIHYELPPRLEEFTHRNGRTARMNEKGMAYLLKSNRQKLPYEIADLEEMVLPSLHLPLPPLQWQTLFVSGGRKDKISKGDIAGLFFKEGQLSKEELGMIELKQDCSFVAVHANKAEMVIKMLNNSKLKNKKVRISLLS